jgi:hypothetical protein
MAVWVCAAPFDGSNGAAAKIIQLHDLGQNAGALLFEGGEGIRSRLCLNETLM